MDNNRINLSTILSLISIVIICFYSFSLGKKSVSIPEQKIDTIKVEIPIPYKVESETKYIYVDREESKDENLTKENKDSIEVSIERVVYQNDKYRAVISGPKIGEFKPTLEEIDIYSKCEHITPKKKLPSISPYILMCGGNNALGIGGGISINNKIDIGIKYVQVGIQDALMLEVNIKF